MIEVAKLEDIKEVIKLALRIPEDLGLDNLPKPDVKKIADFFYETFKEFPIFIYKEEDEIIGFVGVYVTEYWWSTQPVVNDYAFYVKPGHRKLEVINALIGAVRDFAKLNKMPVVSHIISKDRTATKLKLFEKQGFKNTGFIATYGLINE